MKRWGQRLLLILLLAGAAGFLTTACDPTGADDWDWPMPGPGFPVNP